MKLRHAMTILVILLLMGAETVEVRAANFPLYARYLPYTPPNLHLRTARAANAFYLSITSGNTWTFDLNPVLGGTMSLAEGPIPITLAVYRVPANCSGNKTVTVTLEYNIGGVFTTIGSETQTLNIPGGGPIVTTYNFNTISSASSFVLQAGDYIRMSITPATNRLCLVNEFPLGGTDNDATRVILQTGPIISITKSSLTIFDPVNGAVNPKAIPGATVRYTITVDNDATASDGGDNVIVTDPIPADTTYSGGTITLDTGGGPVLLTDAPDADAGEFDGTNIIVDSGTITPGNSAIITFEVIVD